MENELVWEESSSFKIINTPDFFDEESQHPDQDIIDIMAVSHPGPDLLILAIDSENTQEEQVVAQITKLQDAFGEEVTAHLVVMSPDIESSHSLIHLKEKFNIKLAIATEDLVSGCKRWCRGHQSFQYEYNNYSQNVVRRRRTALEKRCSVPPLCHHERADAAPLAPSTFAAPAKAELEYHIGNSACGVPDDSIFNIVLLGLTGTGKSASANTILAAGNSHLDPVQPFKTEPSSMPVTTQCEVKMIKKGFGIQVRVVDTPDFFHEQLKNTQAHVEECKRYCQQRKCVMLLVLQLGRFVDEEEGILEKLEMKLGVKIRDSTIVLLTHGEDLEGNLEQYIDVRAPLKNLVKSCGGRYHLFSNKSKDTKQKSARTQDCHRQENQKQIRRLQELVKKQAQQAEDLKRQTDLLSRLTAPPPGTEASC
ncbi:uncharacterized protein [Pempheris klunzingeri]|uniref:uncharacterized protein n=1 Tax=Pempheris klunzingeri TaxID=3127111 RepID=UPI00397F861C